MSIDFVRQYSAANIKNKTGEHSITKTAHDTVNNMLADEIESKGTGYDNWYLTSTMSVATTGKKLWARHAGNYTNLKTHTGTSAPSISVSSGDLSAGTGVVVFEYDGSEWIKDINMPIPDLETGGGGLQYNDDFDI